jgi:hypothetical protein
MTIKKKEIALPPGVITLGLTEQELARNWGVSPTQLAELDPKYKPQPRRIGGRKVYSRIEAEVKFHELPFWDESAHSDDEWSVR